MSSQIQSAIISVFENLLNPTACEEVFPLEYEIQAELDGFVKSGVIGLKRGC